MHQAIRWRVFCSSSDDEHESRSAKSRPVGRAIVLHVKLRTKTRTSVAFELQDLYRTMTSTKRTANAHICMTTQVAKISGRALRTPPPSWVIAHISLIQSQIRETRRFGPSLAPIGMFINVDELSDSEMNSYPLEELWYVMRYISLRTPTKIGSRAIVEPNLFDLVRRQYQSPLLIPALQLFISCEHAMCTDTTFEATTDHKT